MPQPDPARLAQTLSNETGLAFEGRAGRAGRNARSLIFTPADHSERDTFSITVTLGFRRLEVEFSPGHFAGELLSWMAQADAGSRGLFSAVLRECMAEGAEVAVNVNDQSFAADDGAIWEKEWRRFGVRLQRRNLEIGATDGPGDENLLMPWLLRMTAAVTSLLPLERSEEEALENTDGLPEGAVSRVEVNRYERDRRNRAAALAIHGHSCAACRFDFGQAYGAIAAGFIEVHHTTPVSELGASYIVDPKVDLIPLCPNCHAVAHRRSPPFTVEEITSALERARHQGVQSMASI